MNFLSSERRGGGGGVQPCRDDAAAGVRSVRSRAVWVPCTCREVHKSWAVPEDAGESGDLLGEAAEVQKWSAEGEI
jgi:hypothetical protein